MNFKEYIDAYLNQKVDYDWVYWYQCVDLVKHFSKKVLWIELWGFGWSAKSWFDNGMWISSKWFIKYNNTPDWIPEPWSIIFWKWWPYEQYWHTAIVVYADINNIKVLEQNALWTWNWEWVNAIRLHNYNYDYVAGWYTKEVEKKSYWDILIELSQTQLVALWQWEWYIKKNNKKFKIPKL